MKARAREASRPDAGLAAAVAGVMAKGEPTVFALEGPHRHGKAQQLSGVNLDRRAEEPSSVTAQRIQPITVGGFQREAQRFKQT